MFLLVRADPNCLMCQYNTGHNAEMVKFLVITVKYSGGWSCQTWIWREQGKGFILSCHLLRKGLITKLLRQRTCFILRAPQHLSLPLTCLHGSWSVTSVAYPVVNSQPGRKDVPLWWYNLTFEVIISSLSSMLLPQRISLQKWRFSFAIINAKARVLTVLPFVRHSWLNVVSCSW